MDRLVETISSQEGQEDRRGSSSPPKRRKSSRPALPPLPPANDPSEGNEEGPGSDSPPPVPSSSGRRMTKLFRNPPRPPKDEEGEGRQEDSPRGRDRKPRRRSSSRRRESLLGEKERHYSPPPEGASGDQGTTDEERRPRDGARRKRRTSAGTGGGSDGTSAPVATNGRVSVGNIGDSQIEVDADDLVVESGRNRFQPPTSAHKHENIPQSVEKDVIFVEENRGFKQVRKSDVIISFEEEQTPDPFKSVSGGYTPPSSGTASAALPPTPIRRDLDTLYYVKQVQSVFWTISTLAQGMVAGFAILAIVLTYTWDSSDTNFLTIYSAIAEAVGTGFYLLLTIALVGAIDNYCVGNYYSVDSGTGVKNINHVLILLCFSIAYLFTLAVTPYDDRVQLYNNDQTLWDDPGSRLTTWRALNICRCVFSILAWIIACAELRRNYKIARKYMKMNIKRTPVVSMGLQNINPGSKNRSFHSLKSSSGRDDLKRTGRGSFSSDLDETGAFSQSQQQTAAEGSLEVSFRDNSYVRRSPSIVAA
eukprot:Nk52_evm13s226 gene=Nk52_evmTU13s226